MMLSADEYGMLFTQDLHMADLGTARSQQSHSGQIGVSDLGGCSEYVRRMIVGVPRTDSPDSLPALIGSWVGMGIESARQARNPNLLFQRRLILTLPSGAQIPGTADEIDPDEPSCTDYKTKAGLEAIRAGMSDRQNRWQRHGYYGAAVQAGLVPEQGLVRNVYVDRSGSDERVHVEQEPYDPSVLVEMDEWLQLIFGAVKAGDEAPKERPRGWCYRFCPFASGCRGGELEIGLITVERLAQSVELYAKASEDMKVAEQIKKELRPDLEGVTGRTESGVEVISTWVNSKNGYWRVETHR